MMTATEFWAAVEKTQDCWLWTDRVDREGYGRCSFEGKPMLAHRVAYTLSVGVIPDGMQLDHLCRVRNCVNPGHLEPVTPLVNMRRSMPWRERSTECKNGHEYNDENTRVSTFSDGYPRRICRPCERDAQRRATERKRLKEAS